MRDGLLYVGGDFTTARGESVAHVFAWDGAQVVPLGEGLPDAVTPGCRAKRRRRVRHRVRERGTLGRPSLDERGPECGWCALPGRASVPGSSLQQVVPRERMVLASGDQRARRRRLVEPRQLGLRGDGRARRPPAGPGRGRHDRWDRLAGPGRLGRRAAAGAIRAQRRLRHRLRRDASDRRRHRRRRRLPHRPRRGLRRYRHHLGLAWTPLGGVSDPGDGARASFTDLAGRTASSTASASTGKSTSP